MLQMCIDFQRNQRMARGGKRSGAGRKPTGKVAMLVRVRPEVRARLERDAKETDRSLSAEIEFQLEAAFRPVQPADAHTRALCYLITQIVHVAKTVERTRPPEFNWRANRFDFEAFKSAVIQIFDRLAPVRNEIGTSRYPSEENPQAMGRTLASIIFALLHTGGETLHTMGSVRGRKQGSLFYAFPQVQRDLDLKPRKQGG
jgi:hypothetical protein